MPTDPTGNRPYDAGDRRWLSTLLFALCGIAALTAFGFWFAAIWTHGHDATTRMAGTGCLAALIAGALAGIAAIVREVSQ